ncbi:hypothetical protein V1524DRAFT_441620 [Lipomyces starkeyi]
MSDNNCPKMTNERLSQRSTYSLAQLSQYYDHISLPTCHRNATAEDGLPFLTVLTKYQLAGIPFEPRAALLATSQHLSLDPQHLLHQMIEQGTNRGGYCMENDCLCGTVLRSLGFNVYSVGARASDAVQAAAATPGRSSRSMMAGTICSTSSQSMARRLGGCWLRRQWFAYPSTAPQLSQQTSACRRTGCYVNVFFSIPTTLSSYGVSTTVMTAG